MTSTATTAEPEPIKEYRGFIVEDDESDLDALNALAEEGWTVVGLTTMTRPGFSTSAVPYVLLERERR